MCPEGEKREIFAEVPMNQVWGWLGETKNKEIWIRGGFPGGSVVKNPPASAGDASLIPWKRKWQPIPVFLPGKFHGKKILVGYIQYMGSQRVGHK